MPSLGLDGGNIPADTNGVTHPGKAERFDQEFINCAGQMVYPEHFDCWFHRIYRATLRRKCGDFAFQFFFWY